MYKNGAAVLLPESTGDPASHQPAFHDGFGDLARKNKYACGL